MLLSWIPVVASVAIGLVLIISGVSKSVAPQAFTDGARDLGAPSWVVPIVPWFELVLGALLIVQVARRQMALLALLTLLMFTVVLLRALRSDRQPVCACFGTWSSRPVGAGHVVRNCVLMAVAVIAMV